MKFLTWISKIVCQKMLLVIFIIACTFFCFNANVEGYSTDPGGMPVVDARNHFFSGHHQVSGNPDRCSQFLFENLDPNYFMFGVAKPNFAYFENTTTSIVGTVVHDAQLAPETEPGIWDIIMDSPEPLGGTDLGVLMPDGTIYYCHNTKDPFAFDPLANDTLTVPGDTKVQGCAASKLLWTGKVIMAGGTEMEIYGPGTEKIKQYDFYSKTWEQLPKMLDYRWYPSMTQLADGRLLIVGGGGLKNPVRVNTTELYDPIMGNTEWADTIAIRNEQSPILTLYSGKALMTFRPPQLFDPSTSQWDLAADFVQGNRMPNGDHVDHELVHLPEGEVIAIGYKPFPAGNDGNLWNATTPDPMSDTRAHISPHPFATRNSFYYPTAESSPSLAQRRSCRPHTRQPRGLYGFDRPIQSLFQHLATARPMPRKREYHALALLVPDGRVVVVGGEGQPGNEPPKSIIDAFEPPYLFRGVRPQILDLEKTDYQRGDVIRFDIGRTNAPDRCCTAKHPSCDPHDELRENRFLDLAFSQNQSIEAIVPNDSLRSLPCWYLLGNGRRHSISSPLSPYFTGRQR
ncbi:MAG: hypothetical protein IPJ06_07780 [Saprospiraceae bacterium]|nr:hypothetical protein [Saprospiraceae bacterium]